MIHNLPLRLRKGSRYIKNVKVLQRDVFVKDATLETFWSEMNISKLSRLLKQSHRKTKSWNITGAEFHMTGGMAYRIAMNGYDPANPALRNALGLGPRICPKCQRKITVPHKAPKRIFDMSAKELLWRLKNRKEMTS